MKFAMRQKLFVITLFSLLICGVASAQVKVEKSKLLPAHKGHQIMFPGNWATGLVNPSFAQNTTTGETLVVWYDSKLAAPSSTDPVVGRLVDENGKPAGKPFTILGPPQIGDAYGDLAIAYNPVVNEYLLAYSEGGIFIGDGDPVRQSYVLRLSADGRPTGNAIDITSQDPRIAPYWNEPSGLLFYPKTGGYLFTEINIKHPGTCCFHYFALLNGDGTLNGSIEKIDPYNGGDIPFNRPEVYYDDIAITKSGKLLTTSYIRDPNADPDVYFDYGVTAASLQKLKKLKAKSFKKIERVFFPHPSYHGQYVGLSLAFPSPNSAVIYFDNDENIKGQKVTIEGKLSGASFAALNSPLANAPLSNPLALFSTTSSATVGILTVAEGSLEGPISIWAQILDSNGKPNGSPAKLLTTRNSERVMPVKLVALPVRPGDSVARFVWYGLLQRSADFDLTFPVVTQGNFLEKLIISIPIP